MSIDITRLPQEQYDQTIDLVKADIKNLVNVSEEMRNNLHFANYIINNIIKKNPEAFQYLSEEIKNDENIILKAVRENADVFEYASDRLKDNEEFIEIMLDKSNIIYKFSSDRLKYNMSFINKAVNNNRGIHVLKYVPDSIKEDQSFMEKMIDVRGFALNYFPDKYRLDKKYLLRAIKNNGGNLLKYLPENLTDDDDIAFAAVNDNGSVTYLSDRLKDNEELGLIAVKHSGYNLQYLSNKLKNNQQIVDLAIKHEITYLDEAGDEIKNDFAFMFNVLIYANINKEEIIKKHKEYDWKDEDEAFYLDQYIYDQLGQAILNDRDKMHCLINYDEKAITYLPPILKSDVSLASNLCAQNGLYLRYFDESVKDNEQIVKLAIGNNPHSLEYASTRLKDDEKIVMLAITKREPVETLENTHDTYGFNARQNTVNQNVPFQYASERLQSDKMLVKIAVGVNIANIYYMNESLFNDIPFVLDLIGQNVEVFKHLPLSCTSNKQIIEKTLKKNYKFFIELSEVDRDNIEYINMVIKLAPATEHFNISNHVGKNTKDEMVGMKLMDYIEKAMFRFNLEEKLPTRPDIVKKIKI